MFGIHFQLLRELRLWDKPSALASDGQRRSAGTARHPEDSEPSLWWWYVLREHLVKGREIIMTTCVVYRTEYGIMLGSRLRQIFSQSCLDVSVSVTSLVGA